MLTDAIHRSSPTYLPSHNHCAYDGSLLARRRFVHRRRQPRLPIPARPTNNSPELINIHSAFHAGAYQQVLDFDTSSFSSANALPSRVLKLRAQIALGQAKEVASTLAKETTPDLVAVRLLAEYEGGKDVVNDVKKLVEKEGQGNLTVQLVGGIVLEREGETEEALEVLSKHEGSLDAYVSPHAVFSFTWVVADANGS